VAKDANHRSLSSLPWHIFWIALAARLAYMLLAHTYRIRPLDDHSYFGWEMGRVARAVATGQGYANPFNGQTGPTAWVSPLYPLLLAAVFKVCGAYTTAAAIVILTLNSIFSALTAMTTYWIGLRCFGRRTALWAAWIWALYPPSMQFAVKWIWEMSLSTLLFTAVFALALEMGGVSAEHGDRPQANDLRSWLLFGVLWGLIALSNPSLCIFLPACGLWLLARGGWRQWGNAVAAGVVFVALLAPWCVRNYEVFHRFVPVRTNLGVEFYLGNGPGSTGLVMEFDHPFLNAMQLERYAAMGEVAYAQQMGEAAKAAVLGNPQHFVKVSLLRCYYFWFGVPHEMEMKWDKQVADLLRVLLFSFTSVAGLLGLAWVLWNRRAGAALFGWAFLLLPLTYYFVFVHARFRYPLEPLMAVLGVYLFQSAVARTDKVNRPEARARM
jgi:hypothetical protein